MSEQTKNFVITFRITEQEAEEIEKSIFIDGTIHQKAYALMKKGLEFAKQYPFLTKNDIKPEDAGYPLCDYIKPFYWEGKFIGFRCRMKNPPIDLPKYRAGKLTVKICEPDDCQLCIEARKLQEKPKKIDFMEKLRGFPCWAIKVYRPQDIAKLPCIVNIDFSSPKCPSKCFFNEDIFGKLRREEMKQDKNERFRAFYYVMSK